MSPSEKGRGSEADETGSDARSATRRRSRAPSRGEREARRDEADDPVSSAAVRAPSSAGSPTATADLALLRGMAEAVAEVVERAEPATFGDELRIGADGTPTKRIDELAEQAILRKLADAKGLDVLSEEAGFLARGGDRLLVIDPIDGTTNAVRGIPFYCVSLAIGTKLLSDVECGLVMNLCTGDVFEAAKGKGATLNGRRIRVKATGRNPVYATSGMRPDETPARGILRSFGASALEMSLVAQGAIEGYHYAKPILRVIDIAASTLLVREAGGVVYDAKGQDLDLPLTLTPRFGLTAAADPEVARTMGVPR